MAIYSYTKTKAPISKKLLSVISVVLILTGLTLLTAVIYPIVAFEIYYSSKYANLIKPIPDDNKSLTGNLSEVLGTAFTDYTKASIWFPKASRVNLVRNSSQYLLSIPKLKVNKANVIVGSDDLSKSLIHFTGPLPGSRGNPVIFGHSAILLFYNPSDYKAIFSKLPDLELGDEIFIELDNVTYTFRVYDMFITSPSDLSVLEQNTDDEEITLITCVPPGTYLKRFIVKARLEKI